MKSKQNTIHTIIVAAGVTLSENTTIEGNLKGTLKDKIHLEDFCYNIQKYQLHKSVQLSEETAFKIKKPKIEKKVSTNSNETQNEQISQNNQIKVNSLQSDSTIVNKFSQIINREFMASEKYTFKTTSDSELKDLIYKMSEFVDKSALKIAMKNNHRIRELIQNIYEFFKNNFKSQPALNQMKDFQLNEQKVMEQNNNSKNDQKMTSTKLIKEVGMPAENKFNILSPRISDSHLHNKDQKINENPQLDNTHYSRDNGVSNGEKTENQFMNGNHSLNSNEFMLEYINFMINHFERYFHKTHVDDFNFLTSTDFKNCLLEMFQKIHLDDFRLSNEEISKLLKFDVIRQESDSHSMPRNLSDLSKATQISDAANNLENNYDELNEKEEKESDINNDLSSHSDSQNEEISENQNKIQNEIKEDNVDNKSTKNSPIYYGKGNEISKPNEKKLIANRRNSKILLPIDTDRRKSHCEIIGERNFSENIQSQSLFTSPEIEKDDEYYSPDDPEQKGIIKSAIEKKVKKRLRDMFNQCNPNENCILFLTGHGEEKGLYFILNNTVDAQLTFDDIIRIWNHRRIKSGNHLLVVIDACYLGKWTEDLEWNPKYKDISDVSIQTSSNQYQTSTDSGADTGGCFMNNLLYVNGMRDLFYNYDYKTVDEATDKPKDGQTPTFFTRLSDIESVFRLKIGFNSWESMEKRVRKHFKGTFIGENGEVIRGSIKSIQLHGEGYKKLRNGRIEIGNFKNDCLHGRGKMEWGNMKCEGSFVNGKLTEDYQAHLSSGSSVPQLGRPIDDVKLEKLVIDTDMIREIRRINPRDSVPYEWIRELFNNSISIEGECRNGQRHGFNFVSEGGIVVKAGIWQHNEFIEGVDVDPTGVLNEVSNNPLTKYCMRTPTAENKTTDDQSDSNREESQFSNDKKTNQTEIHNAFARFEKVKQNNAEVGNDPMKFSNRGDDKAIHQNDVKIGQSESDGVDVLLEDSPNRPRLGLMSMLDDSKFWFFWNTTDVPNVFKKTDMEFIGDFNPRIKRPPNGSGILKKSNGFYYDGHWSDGFPHGYGQYHNSLLNEGYSGHWNKGMREGRGRMVFGNRECYEGNWQSDRAIGWGQFTDSNDNTSEGFIVLTDDHLTKGMSRLHSFSGKHKWSQEFSDLKNKEFKSVNSQLVKSQNANKPLPDHEGPPNDQKETEESGNKNKAKVDEETAKNDSRTDLSISQLENKMSNLVMVFHVYQTFPDDFEGSFFKGSYYGLCKFKNLYDETILGEFYKNGLLIRNSRQGRQIEKYEGDILVFFSNDFHTKRLSEIESPIQNERSFTKHGYGKLEIRDEFIAQEYTGLFFMDQQFGRGRQSITSSVRMDEEETGLLKDKGEIVRVNKHKKALYNQFNGVFDGNTTYDKIETSLFDKSTYSGFCLMDKIVFDFPVEYGLFKTSWTNIRMFGCGFHSGDATGKYAGWFVDNKRHGQGRLLWKNIEYEGDFSDNYFCGKGQLKDKVKKSTYKGDLLSNMKHGFGKLTFDLLDLSDVKVSHDGVDSFVKTFDAEYVGQFQNDLYSGEGELIKKYYEKIKNIEFKECINGRLSAEFNFLSNEDFGLSPDLQIDEVLLNDKMKSNKLVSMKSTRNPNRKETNELISGNQLKSQWSNQAENETVNNQSSVKPSEIDDSNRAVVQSESPIYDYKYESAHKFRFSISHQPNNIILGNLRYVKYRQSMKRPYKNLKTNLIYEFDDHTTVVLEFDEEKLYFYEFDLGDELDFRNPISRLDICAKRTFRFLKFEFCEIFSISENTLFKIEMKSIENQIHYIVEKTVLQSSDFVCKDFNQNFIKFTFNGVNNENYIVCLLKNFKTKKRDSFFIEKHSMEIYKGTFKNGQRHGRGALVKMDGSYYEGDFQNNEFHGSGKFIGCSNEIYQGQFLNGKKDGIGTVCYPGKKFYRGQFKNDVPQGKGEFFVKKNDKIILHYYGDFHQGKIHGKGNLNFEREYEYQYEGEFRNGLISGNGFLTCVDGHIKNIETFERNKLIVPNFSLQMDEGIRIEGFAAFRFENFDDIKIHLKFYRFEDEIIQSVDDRDYMLFNFKNISDDPGCIGDQYVGNRVQFDYFTDRCLLSLSENSDQISVQLVFGCVVSSGSLIRDDGSKYTGQFLLKKRRENRGMSKWSLDRHFDFHLIHGEGISQNKRGVFCVGQFSCGQFKKGLLVNSNSDVYSGNWDENRLDGFGQTVGANGELYQGSFKNGKKHGTGLLIKGDLVYFGEFAEDCFEGKGECFSSDFGHYSGQYEKGLRHGRGTLFFNADYSYCGTFLNDKIEGFGTFRTESTDQVREGQCSNGLMHGFGKKTIGNQYSYHGMFENDLFSSYGELKTPSIHYQGHFKNGRYHGRGNLKKHKYHYDGFFVDGLKEGFSKITYKNKVFIYGMFVNNELEDQAQVHENDKITDYTFENSKIMYTSYSNAIKLTWKIQGEYLFDPSRLDLKNEYHNGQFEVIMNGDVNIKFSEEYTFSGRFDYNFYEKEIDIFDCLLIKIHKLDGINQKLLMEPTSQKLKGKPSWNPDEVKLLFTENYDFLKNKNPELFQSIFDSEIQETIEKDVDKFIDFYCDYPEFEKARLFHKYFDSHSERFEKLINEDINNIAKYEGNFDNGMWYEGTVTYKNGDTLYGKFKNYQIKKNGKKNFSDGAVYEGSFSSNRMDGFGTITYPNGVVYEGYFENDKMESAGSLKVPGHPTLHVRVREDFIIRRVKHKLLSNGKHYSGECLVKLKRDVEMKNETSIEDLFEYKTEFGHGVYSEQGMIHQLEYHFPAGLKIVEQFGPENSHVLSIFNGPFSSEIVKQTFRNGWTVIHFDNENEPNQKFIKFSTDDWFLGTVVNYSKHGLGILKVNEHSSQILMFNNDEII